MVYTGHELDGRSVGLTMLCARYGLCYPLCGLCLGKASRLPGLLWYDQAMFCAGHGVAQSWSSLAMFWPVLDIGWGGEGLFWPSPVPAAVWAGLLFRRLWAGLALGWGLVSTGRGLGRRCAGPGMVLAGPRIDWPWAVVALGCAGPRLAFPWAGLVLDWSSLGWSLAGLDMCWPGHGLLCPWPSLAIGWAFHGLV
jgi:hypothetical protein